MKTSFEAKNRKARKFVNRATRHATRQLVNKISRDIRLARTGNGLEVC